MEVKWDKILFNNSDIVLGTHSTKIHYLLHFSITQRIKLPVLIIF